MVARLDLLLGMFAIGDGCFNAITVYAADRSLMNKPVYIIVTPFFPSSSSWRGAYCLDFVRALQKSRPSLRVEVFVPGRGDDYVIEGICVHKFPIKMLPSNVLPFLFRRFNERSFFKAVERVGINFNDVVVCHGHTANFAIYPIAIKRRNPGCMTLLHHHDLASFGLNLGRLRHVWLYNLIMFPILRSHHERIDCHVFISEASRRSFLMTPDAKWSVFDDYKKQMRWLPYRPTRIRCSMILHNGIDEKIFNVGEKPKDRTFTIGCIGNFIDLKDQISLLRAIDILNHVEHVEHVELGLKVLFVGSGPERAKCEEYAKEKEIDAEFRDEVRHEELANFYHELDLFVLPSYFEGFGCVFTEAWACGVPFITCEGQGMDDMIYEEDRDLWLCKPCNPVDLAAKIKYYIERRPKQRLKGEIDIDKLVPNFINQIENIRNELISV